MRRVAALTCLALAIATTAQAATDPPPLLMRTDITRLPKPSTESRRPWPLPDAPKHSGPFIFCPPSEYPSGCSRPEPTPDVDGLLIVLLQSFAPDPSEAIQPPALWYVTVTDAEGARHDPSPGVLGSVHIWNVHMMNGSTAPDVKAFVTSMPRRLMHYTISTPRRRTDGNYDVSYVCYCGNPYAAEFTAVMSHDAQGWHIVSTSMEWTS